MNKGQHNVELPSAKTIKKGEQKIQINAHLTAVCLLGAGYLLSVKDTQSSLITVIMLQILCPIPLLITSSLSYLKVVNTHESINKWFDTLAWWCHTIAYGMILNALALIAFDKGLVFVGWFFFGCYNLMFCIYTLINVSTIHHLSSGKTNGNFSKSWFRKLLNILVYLSISFIGAILPYLLKPVL